jgi:hypothetical protein
VKNKLNSLSRKVARLGSVAAMAGLIASPAFGAVTILVDPAYPTNAAMFTLDPEQHNAASSALESTRHFRQTFQLDSSVLVNELVLSLRLTGTDSGLIVRFFEVDDVLASSWTPGALVHSFSFDTTVDLPITLDRVGFLFSGDDVFLLGQRNSGSQGYGIEISNYAGGARVGILRHSNSGIDVYGPGTYYTQTGTISAASRDFGVAIVPEPSTYALIFGGFALLLGISRRLLKR